MEGSLLSDIRFDSLPLDPSLIRGLHEAGMTHCTQIQAITLPLLLEGKDVLGQAQTGTGKTAAFLLATGNFLLRQARAESSGSTDPRAVILAPTRELAIQIHSDALNLFRFTNLRIGLVYGGVDYDKQRTQLEAGVDILIGTPGRMIDYFKQHIFSMNEVAVTVVDEADRMFDLGFIRDIRYLLRRMPPPDRRLSMLFSATLGLRVSELAYEHMNNPTPFAVDPDRRTADKVTQVLYHVGSEDKIPLLIGLFRHFVPTRTLVFVNTKRAAAQVEEYLRSNGFNVQSLSGDVPQRKRQRLIGQFTNGEIAILVATDVAARGLHIPDVSHVVNFDLPQNAEDYVHRIGRTARAGASGDAISLACDHYVFSLPDIEQYLGHTIPVGQVEATLLAETVIPETGTRHHNRTEQQRRSRRSGPSRRRAGS